MFKLIRRRLGLVFRLIVLLFLLQHATLPLGLQWNAVAIAVMDEHFDYIGWELNALAAKVDQTLFGLHPFMTEHHRAAYVRDYMATLAQAQALQAQIDRIYTDPAVDDPLAASADLRAQRDRLRHDLAARVTLVEAILEGQVAAVLVDEGFGVLGQLIPPIAMRFTQMPNLLVVSPRDKIQLDISISIDPMPVDRKAAIEQRIDQKENVSSLIVPLGGMALYPAMIAETTSIPFAVETFAHEWLHHYLFLFPLGWHYDFAGEARIINETTAQIFGKEIARVVLARYYPDLVPPPALPIKETAPPAGDTPPIFDFGAEMHETRVQVDALLAEGKVIEAEAYMEQRRARFLAHGYAVRKINQAFFAFYGGYQSGGVAGVAGADPIGPAVQAIRAASPSIHDWIVTMREITTRQRLLQVAEAS